MTRNIIKGGEWLVKVIDKADVFTPEDFDDEHKQIGETAFKFAMNNVVPDMDELENHNFDLLVKHLRDCGDLGLLMADIPEKFGGLELDKVTSMIIAEKMAVGGGFSVAHTAHTGIGLLPIVNYGTDDQKERYLEKLGTGEMFSCYCLTEPGSGSDALSAASTAILSEDGKHYTLNGIKQFITNGGFADIFIVFAKIDRKNFTAFILERSYEGLSSGKEEKKLGIKSSSTTQVILEDVKVPVENVLGEIGKGHKIAFNILNFGRLKLGACVTGAAKQILSECVKYTKERKQFGAPISSFGAIQEKITRTVAEIYASESLVYRTTGNLNDKIETLDKDSENYHKEFESSIEDYSIECAIAKVFCSDMLAYTVDEGLQMHGGYGVIQEYPIERYYRDERINRIFEGTNEVNRMIIPGTILKKGLKGELPLQSEAMKAFELLMTPSLDEIDEDDLFAAEKLLINNLKNVFLVLAGSAVQKFMEHIKDEQEILLAAADVVIQLYAIESTVLRGEKMYDAASDSKKALIKAVIKTFAFESVERLSVAAKRGAYYIEEGDNLLMIMAGIRRFTKYDATGLLDARRLLAKAVIEKEGYIF
ncbi:MAG: acyl-CoA dehydrogenase [Deltaproteobacteria bacterium]|nr:acyl-CoA dehydrogenase [Deltaproteobacteria bacterium]